MNRIINIVLDELNMLTIPIIINMAFYILVAWFVSKFAKRTIFRLVFVSFGLYVMITSAQTSNSILFDTDTLVGLGFVFPHIKFMFEWIIDMFNSIKTTTINTYYLFITIYFKIRKFVLWFYHAYKKIRAFFNKENSKQENQNNYYEKQEYSNFYEQDEKSDNRESNYYQEYEEQSSSYTNNNYQNNSNQNPYGTDFEQFFSNDSYIILGVLRSDDKNVIKKAYRKLVMKYHPDVNSQNEVKKYTHICQLINEAYEKIG